MRILFFAILVIGFSALLVTGFLVNSSEIRIVDLNVFDTSEITTTGCSCEDPNNPGIFGPEFCDPEILEGKICAMSEELQLPSSIPDEVSNMGEGCDATFWRELQNHDVLQVDAWPPEYNPDFHFNDIFLTGLDDSYFLTSYFDSNKQANQFPRGNSIQKLEELKAQYADDPQALGQINSVVNSLQNSLDSALWLDDLHLNPNGGQQIFEEDKNALMSLAAVIQVQKTTLENSLDQNKQQEEEKLLLLQGITKSIAYSNRVLAQNALEDSQVYGKDTDEIDAAILEFSNGEEKYLLEDYIESLTFYKNSWIHSQNALGLNNAKNSYGPTLLEVLSEKPPHHSTMIGLHDLAKQSVSALLNSAHKDVSYYYQPQEVLDKTQIAVLEGDVGAIMDFEKLNSIHSELCP